MLHNNITSNLASKIGMAVLFFVMTIALGFSSAPVSADEQSLEFVDLGNLVWYDADMNGLQDAGEPGVPFIPINLYEVPNMLVGTTLTDANGFYEFTGFPAGNYYIQFNLPNGYQITMQDIGSNDLIDSDANLNGLTNGIVINDENEMDETIDLGVFWDINTAVFCDGVDFSTTDWSTIFELSQFNDPRNGTVIGVDIFSYAGISQDIYAENRDPNNSATVTVDGSGLISYSLPNSNVSAVPLSQTYSQTVSPYDGILDYDGTSGFTVFDLVSYNSTITNYPPTGFLGTGTVSIPADAEGQSQITGSGNLAGFADTSAYAGVCVTYYFAPSALAVTMSESSVDVETNTEFAFFAFALMAVTLVTVGARRRSQI